MTIDWPGEKLVIKIVETLEKAIGGYLEPWQIRRVEGARIEARAREILALEQAKKYSDDIRAGRLVFQENRLIEANKAEDTTSSKNASFLMTTPDRSHDLLLSHRRDDAAHKLDRTINLRKIALYAEDEAEEIGDQPVSEEPIDPDWFARWRNNAQDVSREEMQRLWARVLAGEARKPGTFSVHAMDFLARMSIQDAQLLAAVAPFIINNRAIFNGAQEILKSKGVNLDQLLYLEDLGILNGAIGLGGLNLTLQVIPAGDQAVSFLNYRNLPIIFFGKLDGPKDFTIPVISASAIGLEIMSLAKVSINLEYLLEIVKLGARSGFTHVQLGNGPKLNINDLPGNISTGLG